MANVFTRSNDATPAPSRNTFDGSFVNNLTLKVGQLTPCFVKEVIPGDSFRIDATFGFNLPPMVFPVQTEMDCSLHFFYVRNRSLWRGWKEFITKTENKDGDSIPPYVHLTDDNRSMFETGQIGDYIGVPTTYYSLKDMPYYVVLSNGVYRTTYMYYNNWQQFFINNRQVPFTDYLDQYLLSNIQDDSTDVYLGVQSVFSAAIQTQSTYVPTATGNEVPERNMSPMFLGDVRRGTYSLSFNSDEIIQMYRSLYSLAWPSNYDTADGYRNMFFGLIDIDNNNKLISYVAVQFDTSFFSSTTSPTDEQLKASISFPSVWNATTYPRVPNFVMGMPNTNSETGDVTNGFNYILEHPDNRLQLIVLSTSYWERGMDLYDQPTYSLYRPYQTRAYQDSSNGVDNKDISLESLPFASSVNEDGIRISALPFRAYESIYNSFYRDERNNPLIIDGKELYNTWIHDNTGGADTSTYSLMKRNWEQDVFTTAVQSPQQGVMPLVGVTATGNMTFQDEEGKTYYLQATFAEDGQTITGIESYSSDMPAGTLRAMVDTISTGISINDFRNVNALQRWLETNMRKGLRYKDQIEAHFGTSPTYSELDMPEFIGGMSRKVQMNRVVQMSQGSDGSPLGTLAGNATVLGDGGQPVSKFCDEHGWIIGIVCVTPKPVYSQQLNKQLIKTELLDYYFPEFAHLGFQPILNQEITPLQCKDEEGKRLSDVFGYQRAWYEYLSNVDEVHGDFRTSLRHYLIHRVFNDVPQLGAEFLTVSPDEVNEVFAVRDDTDKVFGQIYFDVKMKRPIPAIGIPKLEVG